MSHLDLEKARETMRKATAKWRDHGFELEFADLGYEGERHEVPTYLENLGWRSVGTPMSRLLADNGLAATPHSSDWVPMAASVYYTSVIST
jgi:O-methyltransferase involved in polyketide biosynthesis